MSSQFSPPDEGLIQILITTCSSPVAAETRLHKQSQVRARPRPTGNPRTPPAPALQSPAPAFCSARPNDRQGIALWQAAPRPGFDSDLVQMK